MNFIFNLIPNSIVKAGIAATARHIGTALAAFLITYLSTHGASQSDAATISEAVSALIIGLASYGYTLWDVGNVHAKIQDAQVVGILKTIPVEVQSLPPLTVIAADDRKALGK